MPLDQFIILLLAVGGMFFWNRSESRNDYRHMDEKLESNRELVRAIHDEMKDFHARLCVIEERNKEKR